MSNSLDPDETAHYEPSHLDPRCLQMRIIIACGSERVQEEELIGYNRTMVEPQIGFFRCVLLSLQFVGFKQVRYYIVLTHV